MNRIINLLNKLAPKSIAPFDESQCTISISVIVRITIPIKLC